MNQYMTTGVFSAGIAVVGVFGSFFLYGRRHGRTDATSYEDASDKNDHCDESSLKRLIWFKWERKRENKRKLNIWTVPKWYCYCWWLSYRFLFNLPQRNSRFFVFVLGVFFHETVSSSCHPTATLPSSFSSFLVLLFFSLWALICFLRLVRLH